MPRTILGLDRAIDKVPQQECLWEAILVPLEVLGLEMRLQKLQGEKQSLFVLLQLKRFQPQQ